MKKIVCILKKVLLFVFIFSNLKLAAQIDTTDLIDLPFEALMEIEVVSASRQVETLSEVPVPVTVITDKMIQASAARNLQELLITFVPGITLSQDHNEANVAMRGIYSSSQQKILIMLDGLRLNSRAYSAALPDFSISLEKIKQIEILRGPASSLYGNVALTAVINIILKKGEEIEGTELSLGIGNFGQRNFSVLHGQNFGENKDLLLWASFYQSEGEEVSIEKADDYSQNPHSGIALVGAYRDKPAYDFGLKYIIGDLQILTNVSHSKYVEPFTAGGTTGEVYNYNDYRTYLGVAPGLTSASERFSVQYQKAFANGFHCDLKSYFDHNQIIGMLVTNPKDTLFSAIMWKEYTLGFSAHAGLNYELSQWLKGDFLIGTDVENMRVYDSFLLTGKGGEFTNVSDRTYSQALKIGEETIYSGFAQIKNHFTEKFILNMGFRFDNKDRFKGENVSAFSPRMSLIWLVSDKIDFKLSYAKSFVDAPYWYRYNSLASYKGSEGLLPEHLTSHQVTSNIRFTKQLTYQLNFFHNDLTDIIYRDLLATGDEPRYKNAGKLTSIGFENEITFQSKYMVVNANATYQYALDAESYGTTGSEIHNIPAFTANLILNFYPLQHLNKKLIVNFTTRYIGEQLSPINAGFKGGVAFEDLENRVGEVLLFNSAIGYYGLKNFSIKLQVNNLANKQYSQGGSVRFPYPQAGRWFSLQLGFTK